MTRARLVTIVGPGGIGKTRLALEVPSVVAWCRLGAVSDPAGLTAAMVAGLALPLDGDRDGAIRSALAAVDGWVLIDEAESSPELVATAVSAWLGSSDRVRLLVTSRSRLGLAAEHCLELGPLAVEEGAALYRARCLAVEPAADDPDSDVHALVTRLEGYPLAIELAAARRSVLSPSAVGERLGRSLAVLTMPQGDRPARHRSMVDALQWSWSLLGPAEQRAAVLLSAFVGGMSILAAERVLSHLGDPLVLLEALRHRSWIRRSGERFELYTLVRTWLAEQRDAMGLAAEAAERHAIVMSRFFEDHQFEATTAFVVDRENLWSAFRAIEDPTAALALCRSLVRLERSPPYDPLLAAIDRVGRLAEGQPILQAHAMALRSLVSAGASSARAIAEAERALVLAGDDPHARAWGLIALGQKLPMGHPDTLSVLDEAAGLAREAGDARAEAEAFALQGNVLVQRGRWIDGDRAQAWAVALLEAVPARWSAARARVLRARTAVFACDLAGAHACALEALEVLDPRYDLWLYARGLIVLAELASREGRFADAQALLDQVDALGPVAVRFAPYEVVRTRTEHAVAAGDVEQARRLIAAHPIPESADLVIRAEDQVGRVALLIADQRWTEVAALLSGQAEVFQRVGYRVGEATCHLQNALVAALSGDERAAARWADLAAGLVDGQMGPQGEQITRWADAIARVPSVLAGGPRGELRARLDAIAGSGPLGPTTGRPTADATSRILASALERAL